MNERIKELAEQCRIEEYNSAGDLIEFGIDYEKFAELIVQECINELEATKSCDPYNGELFDCNYNDALAHGIANIKENFGVE